ncbi:hypothetical protein N6H14_10525 [Paenibacillus sp. CC-CFT747]|nr:hypothetical protein N6H14_10525 [Paenibacillus sp. CC-CFT747]
MTHYTSEEWADYRENRLPDDERARREEHLYQCDQCLALYMEDLPDAVPVVWEAETVKRWDDALMAAVADWEPLQGMLPNPRLSLQKRR